MQCKVKSEFLKNVYYFNIHYTCNYLQTHFEEHYFVSFDITSCSYSKLCHIILQVFSVSNIFTDINILLIIIIYIKRH